MGKDTAIRVPHRPDDPLSFAGWALAAGIIGPAKPGHGRSWRGPGGPRKGEERSPESFREPPAPDVAPRPDLRMPGNGPRHRRRSAPSARKFSPGPTLVPAALPRTRGDEFVYRALQAGPRGYLPEKEHPGDSCWMRFRNRARRQRCIPPGGFATGLGRPDSTRSTSAHRAWMFPWPGSRGG